MGYSGVPGEMCEDAAITLYRTRSCEDGTEDWVDEATAELAARTLDSCTLMCKEPLQRTVYRSQVRQELDANRFTC